MKGMMMQLTNMKMSRAEAKASSVPTAVDAEGPSYPYGLAVSLEDDALTKLGMKSLPDVGETFMLMARVEVRSVNQSEYAEGGRHRSLSLQITDMALDDAPKGDAATALYK